MAVIKPFKAVRPSRDKVALVSSKSYEAYTPAELGAKLDFNPFTFLHILNPGYKYQQEVSGEERFKLVHNRYLEFKESNVFVSDKTPCFYVYETKKDHDTFCGIIAATSVKDYKSGHIKKHEATLNNRVQLFENYLKSTGFNAEPVLLTYKDSDSIDDILNSIKLERPEYEFSTTDRIYHKLWVVKDVETIEKIEKEFSVIRDLYIADGHHRSASSALLAEDLASENPNHTGDEAYNYFMSYLIPESHLKISEFNRFVKDLNGLSKEEFLLQLDEHFRVENKGQQFYIPTKKHHFSMYLDGEFYSLYLRKTHYDFDNALSILDAEILYQNVLKPILGIKNINHSDRIGYAHTKKDSLSIKTLVDNGIYKVGFGLIPIDVNEMKDVADEHLTMPPKTTYIEPKLRSGLTLYEF